MFTYQLPQVLNNTSIIQPADFGNVTLKEMNIIPFYGFYFKGKFLNRVDKEVCKEFDGDCYKFT
jgi:hypothetical protein